MKTTLISLVDAKKVNPDNCDEISSQYRLFTDNSLMNDLSSFSSFDATADDPDVFFHDRLANKACFALLWEVIKIVLILSHGQAQVERDFNINKETMTTNLKEKTLIAKRSIIDIVHNSGGLDKVVITPQMRLAVVSARTKYIAYLQEVKEAVERDSRKRNRDDYSKEIEQMKQEKNDWRRRQLC